MNDPRVEPPPPLAQHDWDDGDYATAGDLWASVGQRLVEAVGVERLDVLDLATGTGATAIAAARAGGRVTALDQAAGLLDVARARARSVGVEVRWLAANMVRVPSPDRSFDRVLSTFGAMFAPDPFAMARELVRLCRPGGLIACCAWTPGGVFGRIAPTVAALAPGLSTPAVRPTDWGSPRVHEFFAGLPVECATETHAVRIGWPSLSAAVATFEHKPGPIQALRRLLEPLGLWPAARDALARLFHSFALADHPGLALDAEYLVLRARRL